MPEVLLQPSNFRIGALLCTYLKEPFTSVAQLFHTSEFWVEKLWVDVYECVTLVWQLIMFLHSF